MTAYYNEIDPFAAAWLRELIKAGLIADGFVDERSIEDVRPIELLGYTQCHFFAGIGVWSYALRNAGWPDDRPVWTGSCPCQPFSSAGNGNGFDDERHLWPSFQWLIQQCQPATILGEQVASKATGPWFDLVQSDVEALGYAFGCVPFPSAGVGAPHIRDRAYWVADSQSERRHGREDTAGASGRIGFETGGTNGGMADMQGERLSRELLRTGDGMQEDGVKENCGPSGLADPKHIRHGGSKANKTEPSGNGPDVGLLDRGHSVPEEQPATGPTNGLWRDADWLHCRDGKWRPVEPGTFPLVDGTTNRVGRLRGYGNAINAEAAKAFIESVKEVAA